MEALKKDIEAYEYALNDMENGNDEEVRHYRWVRMIDAVIHGKQINEKNVAFTSGSITFEQIGDYQGILHDKKEYELKLKTAKWEVGKLQWHLDHVKSTPFEIVKVTEDRFKNNYEFIFKIGEKQVNLVWGFYNDSNLSNYDIYIDRSHVLWDNVPKEIQEVIRIIQKEQANIVKVFYLNT